jgi:predicted ATPase
MYAIVLQHFRREYDDIRPRSEALIELARENGLPYLLAAGKMCLARTMAGEGHFQGDEVAVNIGLTLLQEATEKLVASGADLIYSFSLILLGEVYLMMKRPEEGLRVLDDAQQRSEQFDHRLLEAEIHRLRGETMLLLPDGAASAEQSFRRAIDIAQKSGARAWELRAATSLATLLASKNQRDQARASLNSALAQFTEGFDTYDLVQAKSLLTELA